MNQIEEQEIHNFGINHNARVREELAEMEMPSAEEILNEVGE